MRITNFIMLSMLFTNCQSQEKELGVGDVFPRIEAQTLEDKKIIFPDDTKGRFTLLATGFAQEAQVPINIWTDYMLKNHPNVDYYEVPIGNEYFGLFSRAIDNAMKANVPKELHAKTATYYGTLCKQYQSQFGAKDLSTCYIFLLNEEGKIVFKTDGALTERVKVDLQMILK